MLSAILNVWSSFTPSPWSLQSPQAPVASPVAPAGSKFVAGRFDGAEGSLRYKLFVPSGHMGVPIPLIVMLHGGGQDADDFAAGTGMNELAERHKCFVLYPQQSSSANWSMCWNWFDQAHHHRGQGEPGLIAAVTRSIIASHAVDKNRVYVAGLSAGGAMAVIIGRTYPELFAAVGCHSGLAHGSATDHFSAVRAMKDGVDAGALPPSDAAVSAPIIVFHGDSDLTVHPSNSASIVRQFLDGHTAQGWQGPADVSVSTRTGRAGGRAFTRQVHRGKGGRVVAEHWTIAGAGHAWSGGSGHASYADVNGPDASQEMLRFFLQRRLAEGTSRHMRAWP